MRLRMCNEIRFISFSFSTEKTRFLAKTDTSYSTKETEFLMSNDLFSVES